MHCTHVLVLMLSVLAASVASAAGERSGPKVIQPSQLSFLRRTAATLGKTPGQLTGADLIRISKKHNVPLDVLKRIQISCAVSNASTAPAGPKVIQPSQLSYLEQAARKLGKTPGQLTGTDLRRISAQDNVPLDVLQRIQISCGASNASAAPAGPKVIQPSQLSYLEQAARKLGKTPGQLTGADLRRISAQDNVPLDVLQRIQISYGSR